MIRARLGEKESVMDELRDVDVKWLLRKMPTPLRTIAETSAVKLFVAGGFVRSVIAGEPINDVDVFTNSIDTARSIASQLGGPIFETPNAITCRVTEPVIQIIYRWTFETLTECIESFDFTIARAGMAIQPGRGWISVCDEDFYPDLAARRLRYRAPDRREDEAGSMLRMLKFYGRGYRAPLFDIAAVTARAMKGCSATNNESSHRDFILKRLRVIDPTTDPEQEGHLG